MSNRKWTKETCKEEARKYKTRKEFQKGNCHAYQVALKNKWLDDYYWFEEKKKPNGYWTYENCNKEAMKYHSRNEFRKGNQSAYKVARINKWIDDYTWLEDQRFDIITDKVDSVYVYEFKEQNAAYIGRTLIRRQKQRDKDHIFKLDSVSSFAKEHNIAVPQMKILETNLTIKEGVEQEEYWLMKYQEDGWITLNKAKTGSIGGIGKGKWNKKTCYQEARKYKTRTEFEKGNGSAYNAAIRNNWIDGYGWFEEKIKPNGYWDYETCKEEARKYKTRNEFRKGCGSAYDAARINKWLDDYDWFEPSETCLKWDYDTCYNEAKNYSTLKDFVNKCGRAYKVAMQNDWMKDFIWLNKKDISQKIVLQFSLDGKFVAQYNGVREACRINGYKSNSNISLCCNGKLKTAHNFIWRYETNNEFFPKAA